MRKGKQSLAHRHSRVDVEEGQTEPGSQTQQTGCGGRANRAWLTDIADWMWGKGKQSLAHRHSRMDVEEGQTEPGSQT